jgi:hypothetical protein
LYAAEYESLASSVLVVIFATVVYWVACLSLDILLVASPEWADRQIVSVTRRVAERAKALSQLAEAGLSAVAGGREDKAADDAEEEEGAPHVHVNPMRAAAMADDGVGLSPVVVRPSTGVEVNVAAMPLPVDAATWAAVQASHAAVLAERDSVRRTLSERERELAVLLENELAEDAPRTREAVTRRSGRKFEQPIEDNATVTVNPASRSEFAPVAAVEDAPATNGTVVAVEARPVAAAMQAAPVDAGISTMLAFAAARRPMAKAPAARGLPKPGAGGKMPASASRRAVATTVASAEPTVAEPTAGDAAAPAAHAEQPSDASPAVQDEPAPAPSAAAVAVASHESATPAAMATTEPAPEGDASVAVVGGSAAPTGTGVP